MSWSIIRGFSVLVCALIMRIIGRDSSRSCCLEQCVTFALDGVISSNVTYTSAFIVHTCTIREREPLTALENVKVTCCLLEREHRHVRNALSLPLPATIAVALFGTVNSGGEGREEMERDYGHYHTLPGEIELRSWLPDLLMNMAIICWNLTPCQIRSWNGLRCDFSGWSCSWSIETSSWR